nr:hypothetical protein CFP56_54857 [Quercus suber]
MPLLEMQEDPDLACWRFLRCRAGSSLISTVASKQVDQHIAGRALARRPSGTWIYLSHKRASDNFTLVEQFVYAFRASISCRAICFMDRYASPCLLPTLHGQLGSLGMRDDVELIKRRTYRQDAILLYEAVNRL